MGVMTKMRENTAAVLWILVFAFGILFMLQDSQVFDTVGLSNANNIAEVDGDLITYEEYNRAVNRRLDLYRDQTGESASTEVVDLFRQQVFDELVENRLREREMDRLGITVSDSEVIEMVLGDNPDPFIRQQFGDGQGGVNRELLQSVIDNPEARDSWIEVEDYLRSKRRGEKLDKLIEATVRVSDEEVKAEYIRRNKKADARYVALRYADIPDDEVTLSDRDLQRFYDDNREDFARDRSYDVQYVSFSKLPSASDTTAIQTELEGLRPAFETAADDSAFVQNNLSERPYAGTFFTAQELDGKVAQAVFADPTPGRVVGPVMANGEIQLVKIQEVQPAENTAVKARHILISSQETDTAEETEAARQKALDIMGQIRGGADFAELAREMSDDPGSGRAGGDLGWFGRGQMVEPFEEAAYGASVGELVGPVKSQFGFHLIEVQARSDQEARLATLARRIQASPVTLGEIDERARDFQYYASEADDFEAEAGNYGTVETVQITEDMQSIPGIGTSRAITNFLSSADEGSISDVVELSDKLVVLRVTGVTEQGYRPFDEVRAELEPRARLEAKKKIQSERLREVLQSTGGFDGLAEAAGVTERVASQVTYNNTLVPTLGREPMFVGTALGLAQGELSPVLEGDNSAYVLRVERVYEADMAAFENAKSGIRDELLQRKRQQVRSRWLAELKDGAEVSDYRPRFSI